MNILIVDDIATNRKLLGAILESEGHRVTEAIDGVEALAVLTREQVDAVISDILMPRMDGYRFCYEVRANPALHDTPFIFYTSSYTSAEDRKLALEMGADRFLTKPSAAAEIIGTLREATTVHRSPITPVEPAQELNLMKEYNQQLVAKLEERNEDLTALNGELMTLHSQLQYLLEHSPAVLYRLRMEGHSVVPVFVSDNIERLLGVDPTEKLNYDWWLGSLHPADEVRVLAIFAQAPMNGGYSMEYRIRHRDQSYRWIADNSRVIMGDSERPTEIVGVWNDITERKKAEEESENQLRELRRWRELTLGRENRIHLLKQEVNDALRLAGKQPRYGGSEAHDSDA